MALPINVEDLLRQRKVESNRIEFKKGWNPDRLYRSICAFANDFDNIGGGYILVGVEEENGIAKRPVCGIPTEQIDTVLKEITNLNNKINPYYLRRNTGIPTIQRELAHNGSPTASFETDEDRLSFLVRIPCHEGEEGVSSALFNDKEITKENPEETKEITKENPEELLDIARSRNLSEIQVNLLKAIIANPSVTLQVLSSELGLTVDQIRYQRKQLERKGIFLCRKGATKKGTWEINID